MVIFQAYILGRYPHSFYYDYHSILVTLVVFIKWAYYKSNGWHYYITDICYCANGLLIVFLQLCPKNDYMFKACFFFANGCLAVAVGAFRNQMVFHKLDNLSSLLVHLLPQITLWNLRWHTMPYEAKLPEEERRFLTIDDSFTVTKFFIFPIFLYAIWMTLYFMVHFVFARERILRKNYHNMF